MDAVRWERRRAVEVIDPVAVDALAGHVLVLDGVTSDDDDRLAWCRHAPCVVVAITPAGGRPPTAADIALVGAEVDADLDRLLARIAGQPRACRVLVEVLRAMPSLDVPAGLTMESLAYSTLLAGPDFAAWLGAQPDRPSRTFAGPPVRMERYGDDLRIELSRPENRNAFSAAMRDGLFEALAVAEVDTSIRRVTLSGRGPVFSSGGDLTEFGTAADVVRAHEVRTQRSIGRLLARLGPEVVVVVQGSCVGAGVELSAFAGHVVADADATFRLPEVAMGLIPGAGGTVSVTRRIGRQATARLAILGDAIDARSALELGLVDELT